MTATATPIAGDYVPTWEGLIEGWITNFIAKNAWRTAPEYEADDLKQEAFLAFAKCRDRYHVRDRAHFFSLFRRTFTNRITDLAERRTRRSKFHEAAAGSDGDTQDLLAMRPAAENTLSEAQLNELIDAAPDPELRQLLRVSLNGELPRSAATDGVRETRLQILARAAGIAPEALGAAQESLESWARKKLSR